MSIGGEGATHPLNQMVDVNARATNNCDEQDLIISVLQEQINKMILEEEKMFERNVREYDDMFEKLNKRIRDLDEYLNKERREHSKLKMKYDKILEKYRSIGGGCGGNTRKQKNVKTK